MLVHTPPTPPSYLSPFAAAEIPVLGGAGGRQVSHPGSLHYPCAWTPANPGQVLLLLSLVVLHCPSPKALGSSCCSRSCSTGASLCTWLGRKQLLGCPGAWSHQAAQAPSCCCYLHFCRSLGIPLKKKAQFEFRRCQIRGISFKLHPAPQVLPTVMGTGLLLLFLLSEVHPGQENCPKG